MASKTQELFTRFRAGDPRSFDALYRRVAPRLWLWAGLRMPPVVRKHVDAEDLVQEVWLRAHQARERYSPEAGSFRAWVLGIASNVLREQLRRIGRRGGSGQRSLDSSSFGPELLAEMSSVTQKVARNEELHALQQAVSALDESAQRLFVLRGLEELPWQQVAERMQLSVDAAEMRWRRLKEQLRLRLVAPGVVADA